MTRSDPLVSAADGTVTGTLRIEPSVRVLARRLRPGDIAVIDVLDLDQKAAEALASCRPAAVVNVRTSMSGRFPTGGPRVLLDAGIPLVDEAGTGILGCRDGAEAALVGGVVTVDGETVAQGSRIDAAALADLTHAAADGMHVQLATFTANALDHVEREADIILDGTGLPDLGIDLAGRHVVVIAAGYQHREQLRQIRRYLRDRRPVLIAVGDAADATYDLASAPDLIIGDVEGLREEALRSADHVLLHEPHGGDAGQARVDALGVSHSDIQSSLPSAALAILVAHAAGAKVIVTVGVEGSLQDYLESAHTDASGMFLARLQAGRAVVDAPALAQVYRHRYSPWALVALVVSGLVALGAAIWITPGGKEWFENLGSTVVGWFGGA
ncbi:putative cytokinetic ring protein SteA [Demequina sp. NBRC 110056]|uniref:putative cytokinetic ring protein SteA n=1 Tax=Demequina sp. NBRC 110056 TaxID=1570345 RepID=UPI000A03AC1A|nr:putative cytokinetic ring protein SteA [Demequina sp. NBRC 110056]